MHLEETQQAEPKHAVLIVMVVEDEVIIRMMAVDMFQSAGFRVVEASNADEAASLLAAGVTCDLIFTDVNMPGSMNGIDLAVYVKRCFPEIPVILTSGGVPAEELVKAEPAAVVSKPYWDSDLTDAISRVLGAKDD